MKRSSILKVSAAVLVAASGGAVAATTVASADPTATPPSAADLSQKLNALYSAGSASQRSAAPDAITGSGPEPQLIDPRSRAKGYTDSITVTVLKVTPTEDQNKVKATVVTKVANGATGTAGEVPFTFEDGSWKLDRGFACALIKTTGRDDPAC